MYESQIRKIYKEYNYLLNDTSDIIYPEGDGVSGFHHKSAYLCDNIVLWMLCHDTDKKSVGHYGTTTGFALGTIREILRKYIEKPNLKFIGRGRDKNPDTIREKVHRRKKKSIKIGDYHPGYIGIKVSLSDTTLLEVHRMLDLAMDAFEESYIVLHDIDIFADCGGITNREIVEQYLLDNDISFQSILGDRSKVGDDCISWMIKGERRNKVYNKYIQMLQSCDVRKAIGSIIADLVYNSDSKFSDKLISYQDKGMSRVETTFYSSTLQSIDYYTSRMDNLLEFLEECPVYYVSLKKQWKKLVKRLDSTFAIYISNKKIFTYSHWWNSVTGKIQGYSRGKVSKDEVEKLLANYSFNDRPMYFIKGKLLDDGTFDVSKKRTYWREEGSEIMTLVPGISRGLYPSFSRLEREALSFEDVGIVPYKNITIDWPKRTLRKFHKALVDVTWERGIPTIDELENPLPKEDNSNILKKINISSTGKFKSANSLAKDGLKEYTIVKYGYREYYGSQVIHIVADDGTKIRCTKKLQTLVEGQIPKGKPFQVELTRAVKIQGYNDVHCRLVD